MAAIGKGAAPEGLRRLARKSLRGVLRDLQRARSGGESEIHDVRKGLKLVRSLLRMVKPPIGKTFGKERKARMSLGAVRKVLRRTAASAKAPTDIAGLVEEAETQVRVVVNELGRWDLPRRDISPFVTGMRLCYANARKVLKRGLAKEDVAQLHEARKSLIHFRHQLEMVTPLWPSVLKAWADDLQDLREVLGDLGDLEELDCVLGSPICADLPEAFRKTIADLLAARRADLLEKVKPPSSRLFAEKPVVLEKRLEALWMAALRDRRRKAGPQTRKPAAAREDSSG